MKRIILALTIFTVLLTSCGSKSSSFKPSPSDTMRTALLFYSDIYRQVRYDIAFRVGVDSVTFVDVDNATKKKQKTRVHLYYEPIGDTLRDNNNLPIRDSLGNYKIATQWRILNPSNIVHDANINIDSLLKTKSNQ